MNPLKITVVTPSFNQADYLEETLRSVLDQDYANLEYIVMDGGSTDGSVQIIEKYSDYLAFWTSERDSGQSDAINNGFARGTGDIYCWVNSDDLLAPGSLKTVAKYFSDNRDWQVINGGCLAFSGKRRCSAKLGSIRYLNCAANEALANWKTNWFAQPSTFWRSSLWQAVGPLRRDLHFTMDYELWNRFAERTEFHSVPEVLAESRYHESAKCIARHADKSIEMFRLQSEKVPSELKQFLASAMQLFEDLAFEYETQHMQIKKLSAENAKQQAQIAVQQASIDAFKNSRWIRYGGVFTRFLNFRKKFK